jgi:plastocyanin domain-containing protein
VGGRAAAVFSTSSAREVRIAVTERGFEPDRVVVALGETVDFVFTRSVERTCNERVVISLDEDTWIERALPLDMSVVVTLVFAFDSPGDLAFECPVGIHTGLIEVR